MSVNRYYDKARKLLAAFLNLIHPLEIQGLENVPQDRPVVFCANHSNAVDPLLVIFALNGPYIRVMAKKQLFKVPIVGDFIRNAGAFPVDRGNSDIYAVKTALQSVKEGTSVLLFLEGTRVKVPFSVRPKGGAAMIAIRTGVDMIPIYVGRYKKWFRKVPIVFGKPYTPQHETRRGTAEEYQKNADEILRQCYELGEHTCG
jgi:1-acyl-sn-glycerol-3-phosphate acyltransferase